MLLMARAAWYRDSHREQKCNQAKLERGGQSLQQFGQDRASRGERGAEIAGRDVGHINDELLRNGSVEAKFLTDVCNLFGRRDGTGCKEDRRVARQHPNDEEGRNDQRQERGRRGEKPSEDEGDQHYCRPLSRITDGQAVALALRPPPISCALRIAHPARCGTSRHSHRCPCQRPPQERPVERTAEAPRGSRS
jgi:hypothetical protein